MLRRRALLLATPGAAGLVLSGLARAQAETGDPAGDRARLDALEPKVLAQLERFRTPGVSVAVVRSGHVLLVRGYGQRHIAHGLPMTSDTVQPIGSVTKSFTAAVIASLVREGRMRWDQPVRELLPAFRLANEELTQRVTVRDLLTHRTGVARHDTAWFGSPFTREQWMERLRHLEPSAGLRERFQYNNFMVMAAGYVAGVIAGSSWEALVQQRLFVPLGMRRSSTTLAGLAAEADRGSGHTEGDDGRPVLQAYQALDAMGPTGSINSSAADMARYLLMLADGGRFEGRPIVEPGDLAEMTGVQMVANSRSRWRELAPSQYGLGFFVGSYRGERSFEHGGSLPGLASRLIVLPERRLGIFVAANLRRSAVSTTLPYLLIDHLLGLPEVDWSARLEAEAAAQRAAARSADAAGTGRGGVGGV
jgi:CubicO group peptidase (beta-lactamase class C family)